MAESRITIIKSDYLEVSEVVMFSLLIPALLLQLNGVTDCNNAPQLADRLLQEAARLGIQVMQGNPELPGKDASYRAMHGRPGIILIWIILLR